MLDINEEQREQLENGKAVDVTDPETKRAYVVVRKDVYERVCHLLYDDSEWSEDEMLGVLAHAAKEIGWDDPDMEIYDRYDEELRKRCP